VDGQLIVGTVHVPLEQAPYKQSELLKQTLPEIPALLLAEKHKELEGPTIPLKPGKQFPQV
jgi:hypothetical protein